MQILVGFYRVWQAVSNNLLPAEYYGSIPGHRDIQVSLIHLLLTFPARHHAACSTIKSLITQQVMVTIFTPIQLMKYYLCAAYGDSV